MSMWGGKPASGTRGWGALGRSPAWLRLCVLVACVVGGATGSARATQSVLVIYGDSRTLAAVAIFDETLRTTLSANAPMSIDVISEFLELGRYPGDGYPQLAARFLREKYQGTQFLAVVAGGPAAVEFLLQFGAEIFPQTPVIHAYVDNNWLAGKVLPANFYGVPAKFDVTKNLELMTLLHPKARRVVVVTGSGGMDRHLLGIFKEAAAHFTGKVEVEYWDGLAMPDLLRRLASVPSDSVVLTSSVLRDATGRWFTGRESIQLMARVSNAPMYGIIAPQIGSGLTGGYMPQLEETGNIVAGLIIRFATGERVAPGALPASQPNQYIFDWRQLRRWGVSEDRLPKGSIVFFREPSLWDRYSWQIVVGGILVFLVVVLCIGEAVLIGRFVVERRKRRRSEADLRESERSMNLAANAAGLVSWMWDPSKNTISVSERGKSLLGITESEPISLERFLSLVHPDDRYAARSAMERVRRDGGELDHEMRMLGRDGTMRWIESRGRAEFEEASKEARVRGVAVDITARKDAQAEARRHRDQAAHLSRVNILGQLSGALAHELNQPLSAILSNAEAAQQYLARGAFNSDELREILADIIADDRRAGAVIERLRALLKRGESQHRLLDINELARDVERLCRSDLVTRNVVLLAQLTPGLPPVNGDVVQLEQVMLNLVVNACDAMVENEVGRRTITLRTETTNGRHVRVSVSDLGPGLPPGEAERVFEPFVTSKPQGMGLGLSISRSIILAHGGSMWGANNSENGATFSFTLPAAAAAVAA